MANSLTKKAVEMLLNGATLMSDPCPYCKGVRVMKDGFALCVNCGKEPRQETIQKISEIPPNPTLEIMEKKLSSLSSQLEKENDPSKQHEILKTINFLLETIEKIKKTN